MTPETNTSQQQNDHSTTAWRVLERIDKEVIIPTPRWQFSLSEGAIWVLWAGTVFFGAVALAVTAYVTMSATYALYEATHENFVTFLVESMPYVWLMLFLLLTYLAVFEIKKTKRGYRYNTFLILGSSLFGTLLGAIFFHSLGMGYLVDKTLGQQLSMYMSMEKMEQKMWQMPQAGRLIGQVELSNSRRKADIVINFKDGAGVLWRLSDNELNERERTLLLSGALVRMLGTTTSEFSFHACGVFPLMQERAMGRSDMMHEREEFTVMMQSHRRMMDPDDSEFAGHMAPEVPPGSLCAHLEMMKRMPTL